jgi:predicted Zn-ribbon and HTH transcriptional regulator
MREIVLAEIASLFCEKHYGIDIKTTPDINVYNDSLDFAGDVLSLPVEGCEVKEKCPYCAADAIYDPINNPTRCPKCGGSEVISRPLTLGELLKKAPVLIKIARWANDENDKDCMEFFNCPSDESWCSNKDCPIDNALAFKDKP